MNCKHKFIIIFVFLFSVIQISAQVVIGAVKSPTTPGASLEFATGNRGLVLPWGFLNGTTTDVDYGKKMPNAVAGTLVFDLNDRRIRFNVNGTANGWSTLTPSVAIGSDGVNPIQVNNFSININSTIQDNKTELANSRTKIGSADSGAPGILVLEDSDKAMILPKVDNPHTAIVKPAAGMMVYDTTNNLVCFFNGTVWTFYRQ